jgi:molybdopterin-guanine dinucleotide biosynthesis protein A
MGRDKALLPTHPHGEPLIYHLAQRLCTLPAHHLIVVSNSRAVRNALFARPPLFPTLHFLADAYADAGALGGIATGLRACPHWAAVVACDMPLLNPRLLNWLWELAEATEAQGAPPWDAIVPVVDGQVQPFHALYHPRCLSTIESHLAAGQRAVWRVLADVRTRFIPEEQLRIIDPALRSFYNVNTPEEWQQAQEFLARQQRP